MAVASKSKPVSKKKLKDVNVIAILDMSGSMWGKEVETRGGFNSFLEQAKADQRKEGGKVTVSLTCFDTEFIKVFDTTPIEQARVITALEYTPRGNTALYDAIGRTISGRTFPKEEKVMVIITTDGQENSSTDWVDRTSVHRSGYGGDPGRLVRELIAQKEAEGWEFMFLGVGLDAFAASRAFTTPGMTHNTVSTPGTAAAAGATTGLASTEGYHALRGGKTVRHAVASAYAGDSAFSSFIDRSVPDQRDSMPDDPKPSGLKVGETSAAKLKRLRKS